MTVIFKAKTRDDGYTIKILSELLQNITKLACFHIHQQGIDLRMMNSQQIILTDISLQHNYFDVYQCVPNELYLGINLNNLYKMLKIIKKKDTLELRIDDENPETLQIIVNPKDNNKLTMSSINIQHLQNLIIPLPSGYGKPINIPSGDVQRTLKDMSNMSNNLTISMKNYSLFLECMTSNIYSRKVHFGEINDETDVVYEETFDMEYFSRILKIASLGKQIQVYGSYNLPLLLQTKVGQLGVLSVYIKSQALIEKTKIH